MSGDIPRSTPGPEETPAGGSRQHEISHRENPHRESQHHESPHLDDPRQDQPGEDEAFERIRAADPAATLEPDLVRLREAVAARVAVTGREDVAVAGRDDVAGAAFHAAPTPERTPDRTGKRSPRSWFTLAAAVAGALVIGSSGYGLGALNAGPADRVITLNASGGLPESDAATLPGANGAGPLATSGDARIAGSPVPDIWPWWPSRVVFTASGLSDQTTTSRAYGLDPGSVFSAASAERAAAVFGVEGTARKEYGSWVVGPRDGRGPSLTLSADGSASLSFHDPTKDPWLCAEAAAREEAALEGIRLSCAEPSEGSAPRGSAAAAEMRRILEALGITVRVEIETTEYNVPETGGPRMTSVSAYALLDGQRVGMTWSATLVANGVQSFYGPLAPLVDLGEYDVVSENEAVRRLGDPRFGFSGGPIIALAEDTAAGAAEGQARIAAPEPAVGPGAGVDGAGSDAASSGVASDDAVSILPVPPDGEPTIPPTPEPGAAIPWPVTEVTITKARLGLTQQWLPNGSTVLLPAYELSDADGRTWAVLAVADADLDFSEID